MAAVPTSPERIRASLSAEIDMADNLLPLTKEALQQCFVPFAELFCREQAKATPEAGFAVADAAAAVAAAVIGHLHMNVSRPGVDRMTAVHQFVAMVEQRVLRSLVTDGVPLGDSGRAQ